jgi:hypothetical protein
LKEHSHVGETFGSGITELLRHASLLIESGQPSGLRLGFLAVDNSVELILRTFLESPPDQRFPELVRQTERRVSSPLPFADVLQFHRLRNRIYHGTPIISVDQDQVVSYLKLSLNLFRALFGFELPCRLPEDTRLVASFLRAWARLSDMTDGFLTHTEIKTFDRQVRRVAHLGIPVLPPKLLMPWHWRINDPHLKELGLRGPDQERLRRLGLLHRKLMIGSPDSWQELTATDINWLNLTSKKVRSRLRALERQRSR